ncbi:uncharacterized protein BO96DRAFT_87354 [Aspergillus niger CBS 101883]|uniref:uncharacterized protein n=1 Tax=Aspergillus lacticoffeatus (strain CBS 101883) TaxID=1450533 RepID=UPI000D8032EF|nr:uncharacterized protein BO96DRAFT_87354 [Aspergillus niger CBS 101883]PYH60950.1 hypothetical protein BO96DRAFT_87354 [Aspergillus niger CBS 101883]
MDPAELTERPTERIGSSAARADDDDDDDAKIVTNYNYFTLMPRATPVPQFLIWWIGHVFPGDPRSSTPGQVCTAQLLIALPAMLQVLHCLGGAVQTYQQCM